MLLLWLLLWTPKLALSNQLSLWDMLISTEHEDIDSRYTRTCERVIKETTQKKPKAKGDFYEDAITLQRMVDIDNGVLGELGALHVKAEEIGRRRDSS